MLGVLFPPGGLLANAGAAAPAPPGTAGTTAAAAASAANPFTPNPRLFGLK